MAEIAEALKVVLFDTFAPDIAEANNSRQFRRRTFAHTLTLELTGDLVVGAFAATLKEDGVHALVKKLIFQILADIKPFSVSGRLLHRINSYVTADEERVSQPAVTVGTNPFRASFDMHFIMLDTPLAEGFKLNTALFKGQIIQDPTFDIRLGVASDLATPGGGGTVALANLNVNATVKDEDLDTTRENELREEIQIAEDLTFSTEANSKIDLQDNNILRRLAIQIEDDGTGLLADDVIDSVKIVRNSDITIREFKWKELQSKNKKEYGLGDDLFASISKGFAILNLDSDFDLSGILDTRREKGTKTLDFFAKTLTGKTARMNVSKEVILVKA